MLTCRGLALLLGAAIARADDGAMRSLLFGSFDKAPTPTPVPTPTPTPAPPTPPESLVTTTAGGSPGAAVHYPTVEGRFPLVVALHGLDGVPAIYTPLFTLIAASGFVVVAPTHTQQFPSGLPPTSPLYGERGAVEPSVINDAIATAKQLAADSSSPLYGKVDAANIVVFGHSWGGGAAIAAMNTVSGNCFWPMCGEASGLAALPDTNAVLNFIGGNPAFSDVTLMQSFDFAVTDPIKAVVGYGSSYPEELDPSTAVGLPPLSLPTLTTPLLDVKTPVIMLQGAKDGFPQTSTAVDAPLLFGRLSSPKGYVLFDGLNHGAPHVIDEVLLDLPQDLPKEVGFERIGEYLVRIFSAYTKADVGAIAALCAKEGSEGVTVTEFTDPALCGGV